MASEIRAPMVGKILEILVVVGEQVDAEAELLVIESMKMEIPVSAANTGSVQTIHVVVDEIVQEGDLLITLAVG